MTMAKLPDVRKPKKGAPNGRLNDLSGLQENEGSMASIRTKAFGHYPPYS
jgi:hypothetical protein